MNYIKWIEQDIHRLQPLLRNQTNSNVENSSEQALTKQFSFAQTWNEAPRTILLNRNQWRLKFVCWKIKLFGQITNSFTMDYLRMDGKRGHVTCGNRLAIERQESFPKFASLQEELLLPSAQACWDPARFRMAWYGEKWLQLDKMKMFFKIYAWCLLYFSERRLAWLWVSLGNFSFMLIWWSFQVRALHNFHSWDTVSK